MDLGETIEFRRFCGGGVYPSVDVNGEYTLLFERLDDSYQFVTVDVSQVFFLTICMF